MHSRPSRLPEILVFLGGVAAGALVPLWSAPARAASDPELLAEIRALKARLHKLEGRVDKQAKSDRGAKAKTEASADDRKDEKKKELGPDKFLFRGLTIQPGGFLALESVWRSRWIGADINTPFQNIPYDFFATAHSSEFRFSARPTRLSMLVKGDIDPFTAIAGYVETDFLGAAQTANSNESNSYNLRLRQAYTNIDWDFFGAHFLFGQAWSLVTLNKLGIRPDTTVQPPTIDHQYIPGYTWARQPGLRLVADIDKRFWLAFAAEGAATTFAGYGVLPPGLALPRGITGTTNLPLQNPILFGPAAGGGAFNIVNSYSLNRAPDLIAKVAWDARLGDHKLHVEGFGLMRNFTTRAYWGNHNAWGGGFGGGAFVSVIPDLLDFQVSGAIGHGIGRYGSAQLADATWSVTGAPLPIDERMLLIGATLHATPQTDIYAFAGGEFASRNPQFAAFGPLVAFGGYANPFFNNLGCNAENDALTTAPFLSGGTAANVPLGGPFACAGLIKSIRQITGGVWHTLYEGSFGKVRAGVQYSYTVKDGFFGFGGSPTARDSMVFTSFRYYPFEGASAPAAPVLAKY